MRSTRACRLVPEAGWRGQTEDRSTGYLVPSECPATCPSLSRTKAPSPLTNGAALHYTWGANTRERARLWDTEATGPWVASRWNGGCNHWHRLRQCFRSNLEYCWWPVHHNLPPHEYWETLWALPAMWQDSTTGRGQWRLEGTTSCEGKEDSEVRLNVNRWGQQLLVPPQMAQCRQLGSLWLTHRSPRECLHRPLRLQHCSPLRKEFHKRWLNRHWAEKPCLKLSSGSSHSTSSPTAYQGDGTGITWGKTDMHSHRI